MNMFLYYFVFVRHLTPHHVFFADIRKLDVILTMNRR